MGKIPAAVSDATLIADLPGGAFKPERAADLALGAQLRAYEFERYKTKRKEEEEKSAKVRDRKSTRLNSSHSQISYAVFCLKKKKNTKASIASTRVRDPQGLSYRPGRQ